MCITTYNAGGEPEVPVLACPDETQSTENILDSILVSLAF